MGLCRKSELSVCLCMSVGVDYRILQIEKHHDIIFFLFAVRHSYLINRVCVFV